jgi:formamidopyrimidine-DNA glycosylase
VREEGPLPELPEVESVRRGLVRARLHAPVVEIWRSRKPLRIGETWRRENLRILSHARPIRVRRRGKYIVWQFESPDAQALGLVVHLGMSGRLTLASSGSRRVEHTHLVLRFADDREVRFVDPRRFGGLRAGPLGKLEGSEPLCGLGPEPLSRAFDADVLRERAGGSRRVIRDVLLDQRVVAGIGNIYALEALFEAGVHPLQPAHRLSAPAWRALAEAIDTVLRRGVRNGGTTLRDFRGADGRRGRNQTTLAVYGRGGQPCRRCGTILEAFVHGNRGGALCPRDQPLR